MEHTKGLVDKVSWKVSDVKLVSKYRKYRRSTRD